MAEWINGVQTSKFDILCGTAASFFVPFAGITGGVAYLTAVFSDAGVFLNPLYFAYGAALTWMYKVTLTTIHMNLKVMRNARR
jgi:hypothetical protein